MAESHPIPKTPGFQDLTGKTFTRWLVIHYAGRDSRRGTWWCRCKCGAERVVPANKLTSGWSRSCGCLRREETGKRHTTHGQKHTPEYSTWCAMKRRCHGANSSGHHKYGARGIAVCQRWRDSFEAFLADVGPRPSPAHTIGRIDNEQGYFPGNVRWETIQEQAHNKRTTRKITHDGLTLSAMQWARKLGIRYMTLIARLNRGWSVDRALSTPP
jgi:hypothetical protein